MKPDTGPGVFDVVVTVLSPAIVAGLTVIFLLGWWLEAAWRRLRGCGSAGVSQG